MGTSCAPFVTDSCCYGEDFILCLSRNNQADFIEEFKYILSYLIEFLNIDNPYFEEIRKIRRKRNCKNNKNMKNDSNV